MTKPSKLPVPFCPCSPEKDQNGRPLPRAAKATPMARPNETLAGGRLASTPEGTAVRSLHLRAYSVASVLG